MRVAQYLSPLLFSVLATSFAPSVAAEVSPAPAETTAEDSGEEEPVQDQVTPTEAPLELTESLFESPRTAVVTEKTLPGGVRLVLEAQEDAPVVSVCTAVDAGTRWDPKGRPGVARVLAEILREGGYRSESQDYAELVRGRGGKTELFVAHDSMVFCTTVPRAELPLALWVAAGRFSAKALTEAELRKAVQALSWEAEAVRANVREGQAPERLRKMAFLGAPAWDAALLPSEEELQAITLADVRAFHQKHYGAERTFLALSGGMQVEQVQSLAQEHLKSLRSVEKSAPPELKWDKQSTERFSMAEDVSAKTPAAWYGWPLPEDRATREAVLLGLYAAVHPEGNLHKKLVGEGRAAFNLRLSVEETGGPALARIDVLGRTNSSLGTIESELNSELTRLMRQGPTNEELARGRAWRKKEQVEELLSTQGRAFALARGGLLGRSPAQILAPLQNEADAEGPSAEAVRQAASTYLANAQRSIVEVYPKGWQDPWQSPMPVYHIVNPGESLGAIARSYGTTVAGLVQLNRGLDPKKSIYPGDKLRVPRVQKKAEPEPLLHTVKRGDTLSGLAVRYGVSVQQITEANGMGAKQTIRLGEQLRIPRGKKSGNSSSNTSASPSPSVQGVVARTHRVKSGETLSGIARSAKVSLAELARLNGLTTRSHVRVGQELKLPASSAGGGAAAAPVIHQVKSGETLIGIAKRYGVSVRELTQANRIQQKSTLRVGQKLTIPARSASEKK